VKKKISFGIVMLAVAFMPLWLSGTAEAKSSYLTSFNSTYPSAPSAIKSCTLCHPGGNTGSLNSYANDYKAAARVYTAIEAKDSDGDGATNLAEINAGTFPGDANSKPVITPPPAPTLSSLAISGPSSVDENGVATFVATASWSNGSTSLVTPTWSENSTFATISASGVLSAAEVTASQSVTVSASYSASGVTKTATKTVTIVDIPTQVCTDQDGDGFAVEGGACGAVDPDDNNPSVTPNSGKTPLNDTSAFVEQLYWDIFSRDGDTAGILYWSNQIDSAKSTKAQAAEIFLLSPEHQYKVASISRLYLAYYQRCPDYDGLMYWVSSYAQGVPLEEISLAFALAPEFQDTYGNLDNGLFIDLIYRNVLGRNPDPQGLAFWTNQLDTGNLTRGQVMIGFSESEEYKAYSQADTFVSTAYSGLLRRAPSQVEYDSWVNTIKTGGQRLELIDSLLNSSQYAARFGN